jgi:hypothetical protein
MPTIPISQSEVIVGALIVGFIVFLAVKGRLGAYWSLLVGGGAATGPNTVPATGGPAPSIFSSPTMPTPQNPSGNVGGPFNFAPKYGWGSLWPSWLGGQQTTPVAPSAQPSAPAAPPVPPTAGGGGGSSGGY